MIITTNLTDFMTELSQREYSLRFSLKVDHNV